MREEEEEEKKNQSTDDPGQDHRQSPSEQSIVSTREGEALFNAGKISDAQTAFNKALEIDPKNVSALNNLGVLSWHKGDIDAAIESFEKVLKIDPCNEDAAHNLQKIHEDQQLSVGQQKTDLRPRLSICIPTYNRAEILHETLTHLEQVCGDDVEIVISDNCSPDQTQEVVTLFASRFRHFRAIRQPENRGALKNIAAAMSLASGKYIYTLCDDDQIHADGLRTAISIMEETPGIVGVYGGHQEWDRSSGKIIATLHLVDQKTDFMQGDKVSVFNRFNLLWFPVCRTDIFQRYFTYDNQSFGMWELVGTLLEHGAITIIPELFYKHTQTVPRMEYELTESWYHDAHRAQYECFAGRLGPLNFAELSTFVNSRVAHAYNQGARFAEIKRNFLRCRHFLLRSRAYGLIPEAQVMEWEKRELVGMVAERLLGHVELIPEIEEVLFEDTPNLQKLREHFSASAPGYTIGLITQDKWRESGLRPNQYLVIYSYALPGWSETIHLGPARCRAVQDIIETCRITDQPLEF